MIRSQRLKPVGNSFTCKGYLFILSSEILTKILMFSTHSMLQYLRYHRNAFIKDKMTKTGTADIMGNALLEYTLELAAGLIWLTVRHKHIGCLFSFLLESSSK